MSRYNIGDMLQYQTGDKPSRYFVVLGIVDLDKKRPVYKLFDMQESYYRHVYCEGHFSNRCIRVS